VINQANSDVRASNDDLQRAYRYCQDKVKAHYENFPVASLLLPRRLRKPISAIYAFARTADDFADEGDASAEQRIASLQALELQVSSLQGHCTHHDPMLLALDHCISVHRLPLSLFLDLLSAFKQDVTCTRYQRYEEVLDYCRRSANPIGRLLLHLTGHANQENLRLSDNICSALQIINFLQDMRQDIEENQRIYMPMEDLKHFQVDDGHFRDGRCDNAMRQLFDFELARAKALLLQGSELGLMIRGRFGMQLRMMIGGGIMVCQHLEKLDNCFDRPRLMRRDWLSLFKYAIMPSSFKTALASVPVSTSTLQSL